MQMLRTNPAIYSSGLSSCGKCRRFLRIFTMHIDHDHIAGGDHNHTHAPMEELVALMKYMVGHIAAHAKELAEVLNEQK